MWFCIECVGRGYMMELYVYMGVYLCTREVYTCVEGV